MIKNGGVEFAAFPANGKQGPAALTNNKQEYVAGNVNVIKRSGKKYKKFHPKPGQMKSLKTCRNPYLGLDLSMHVNITLIRLVTQSLKRPKNT
jgi:hypothetical protein